MGQSRISTHLGCCVSGLVQSRRDGKRTFTRFNRRRTGWLWSSFNWRFWRRGNCPSTPPTRSISRRHSSTQRARRSILTRSRDGFTRSYGPGRSWEAFGQLLRILPPIVVVTRSVEGSLSEPLARAQRRSSPWTTRKMVAFWREQGKEERAEELSFARDLENPPIEPRSVDLVVLSQVLHHAATRRGPSPRRMSCWRVPAGAMVLDLLKHTLNAPTNSMA